MCANAIFLAAALFGSSHAINWRSIRAESGEVVQTLSVNGFVNRALGNSDPTIQEFDTVRDTLTFLNNAGGRSDINWDGPAVTGLTRGRTTFLDGRTFLDTVPRQVISDDMMASEDAFRTIVDQTAGRNTIINPSFDPRNVRRFAPFSPTVTTAPLLARNSMKVHFTLADKKTAGLVHGFGAIFTDVQRDNLSGLTFFDANNRVITRVNAVRTPRGASGQHQLVSAFFAEPIVASVEIRFGNNDNMGVRPNADRSNLGDLVVVDDWKTFLSVTAAPLRNNGGRLRGRSTRKLHNARQDKTSRRLFDPRPCHLGGQPGWCW